MKKRILAVLLASMFLITLLAACKTDDSGSKSNDASAESSTGGDANTNGGEDAEAGDLEDVTLIWYYPDDKTNHTDVVWGKLNEYFKQEINATVEYHPIEWGTYSDKVNTVMSSGQKADIIFNSATYFNSVASGAAQPIEDFLPVYGKEMWEELPDYLWTAATVNGHIYGVPTYKDNAAVPGLQVNTTITDDLGIELPESFGSLYEMEEIFYEIKEKRDEKYPELAGYPVFKGNGFFTASESLAGGVAYINIPGIDSFEGKGSGDEVFSYYHTDEALFEFSTMRKWVEDGIYPLDAPNYDTDHSNIYSGKIPIMFSLGLTSCAPDTWGEEYNVKVIPSTYRYLTTDYIMFGSNIISATSDNPERAVMLLNLVNTDNYVANTIRFGVEGEYFNVNDEGFLDFAGTLNEDPTNRSYYKWYGWQFGNLFAMTLPGSENETLWDELQEANDSAYLSDNLGFVFDQEPVINEITALSAVKNEYYENLVHGVLPDPEAALNDMRAKLEASGLDVVIEEIQRQLDEWREESGKTVFAG